jgi:hypothetical protein
MLKKSKINQTVRRVQTTPSPERTASVEKRNAGSRSRVQTSVRTKTQSSLVQNTQARAPAERSTTMDVLRLLLPAPRTWPVHTNKSKEEFLLMDKESALTQQPKGQAYLGLMLLMFLPAPGLLVPTSLESNSWTLKSCWRENSCSRAHQGTGELSFHLTASN